MSGTVVNTSLWSSLPTHFWTCMMPMWTQSCSSRGTALRRFTAWWLIYTLWPGESMLMRCHDYHVTDQLQHHSWKRTHTGAYCRTWYRGTWWRLSIICLNAIIPFRCTVSPPLFPNIMSHSSGSQQSAHIPKSFATFSFASHCYWYPSLLDGLSLLDNLLLLDSLSLSVSPYPYGPYLN